jgi:hypothetical protein
VHCTEPFNLDITSLSVELSCIKPIRQSQISVPYHLLPGITNSLEAGVAQSV